MLCVCMNESITGNNKKWRGFLSKPLQVQRRNNDGFLVELHQQNSEENSNIYAEWKLHVNIIIIIVMVVVGIAKVNVVYNIAPSRM